MHINKPLIFKSSSECICAYDQMHECINHYVSIKLRLGQQTLITVLQYATATATLLRIIRSIG